MKREQRRSSDLRGSGFLRALAVSALFAGLVLLVACITEATAAEPGMSRVVVPQASFLHRLKMQREVIARFGTDESLARIAGQVHTESRWNPTARSKYAEGMAQFTPDTSRWLESVCPEIGAPDPWSADWSVRAVVCYDAWLYARVSGASACDQWAFTLSAYNGGLGWIARDKRRAETDGADPMRWFGQVEHHSPRAAWAIAENRAYVRRILMVAEPAYIAAGWPGVTVCS